MHIRPLLISALTSTLLLSACGGGSGDSDDDDIVLEPPVMPATVPADEATSVPLSVSSVNITSTSPLMVVDTQSIDLDSDEEQIFNVHGILVRDDTVGTVRTDYETYCEASYLRTNAATAEMAYDDLTNGMPQAVFALDVNLDNISFTGINTITHQGRQGQEYLYTREISDSVLNVEGRGRAFYFNAESDNLIQSAIFYFECFGFGDTFFENAPLVDALLESIEFNESTNAVFTFSSDPNSFTTVLTSDGESL